MITDPPPMPPPVIATALNEPLALTSPEAARTSGRRSRSGGSGAGGSGASGSNGASGSSPIANSGSSNDAAAGAVPTAALAALALGNSQSEEAEAPPPRPPKPSGSDVIDKPNPAHGSPGPAATASSAAAPPGALAAAAPPSAGVAAAPLSLQDQCCKVILRHISVHNCLELLGAVQGQTAPSLETIAAASLRYVVTSFETLQGLRSEEELRAVLPVEVYDNLVSAQEERMKAVEEMRRVGRAVERQAPPADLGPVQVPSVTGRPVSYPAEALKAGLVWPEGVQASDRETWLSEADFRRLFKGLGYQEFCKLPAWKKTGYKQDAGMF